MNNTNSIPGYSTLMLGTEGAGKTVFIASMYQYLSIQHEEVGFYLAGEPTQHRVLINQFQTIRNSSEPWPPTTTKVDEWNFTCQIRNREQNFNVFNYTYYDYPGEILTEEQAGGSPILKKFEEIKKAADTWLVILDGEKIRAWIDGKPKLPHRKTNIMQDLDFILPHLQNSLKTTHFVVTKWDLVDRTSDAENNTTLAVVRKALMQNVNFSSIVKQLKNAGMPARIIPVSSVGNQFVTPGNDGTMIKNPNSLIQPFMVEMPVAFTLLDAFQANHVRLSPEHRNTLKNLRSNWFWSKFVSEAELLRKIPLLPKFKISRQVLSVLTELIEEGLTDKSLSDLKKKRLESASKTANLSGAMKTMVLNHAVLAKKLILDFPSSDLNN